MPTGSVFVVHAYHHTPPRSHPPCLCHVMHCTLCSLMPLCLSYHSSWTFLLRLILPAFPHLVVQFWELVVPLFHFLPPAILPLPPTSLVFPVITHHCFPHISPRYTGFGCACVLSPCLPHHFATLPVPLFCLHTCLPALRQCVLSVPRGFLPILLHRLPPVTLWSTTHLPSGRLMQVYTHLWSSAT